MTFAAVTWGLPGWLEMFLLGLALVLVFVMLVFRVRRRWARRLIAISTLVAAIMVLTTSISLRAAQYMFRKRMELLLSDVRGLELHKTNAEEARRVFQRWGFAPTTSPDRRCTDQECEYVAEFTSPAISKPISHLYRPISDELHKRIIPVLVFLGGRPAVVTVVVGIREGIVSSKIFRIFRLLRMYTKRFPPM